MRIRYGGLNAALALKRELEIPYHAIQEVSIGLDDVPSTWTVRRIGLSDPITGTRKGHFWVGKKRFFLDVRHPERALVLCLKPGYHYDVVAVEVDHPESLLDAIRAHTSTFTQPSDTTTGNVSTGS